MRASLFILAVLALSLGAEAAAQELSPRAYWPAPHGTKLAFFGFSYSSGDVATDPSLPIIGIDSRINTAYASYLRTLSLFGRTSNFILEVPYVWGKTRGEVDDVMQQRAYSAFGDIALTLSINLLGAPTLSVDDFRALRAKPRAILGASLRVLAPTGSYYGDRLINVGANRWAAKAELGYVQPLAPRWMLEVEAGIWFFGDNDDFLGVTREQDSLSALEIHLIRRFEPGFWASLDLNHYRGGRSTVGGVPAGDLQRNSKIGFTLAKPIDRRHAIKLAYNTGVVTETGGDFDTWLVSFTTVLP